MNDYIYVSNHPACGNPYANWGHLITTNTIKYQSKWPNPNYKLGYPFINVNGYLWRCLNRSCWVWLVVLITN